MTVSISSDAYLRIMDERDKLKKALAELLEAVELADKNDDLPVSLAGYGRVFIDNAKAALAQL